MVANLEAKPRGQQGLSRYFRKIRESKMLLVDKRLIKLVYLEERQWMSSLQL